MAAKSRDQSKIPGSGAQVLRAPDTPVKFQGFRCNGVQVLGEQKSGGRRKKKKIKAASSVCGAQAISPVVCRSICACILKIRAVTLLAYPELEMRIINEVQDVTL